MWDDSTVTVLYTTHTAEFGKKSTVSLSHNMEKPSKRGRVPALVNPDLKPFLNHHVNLHVQKKAHLKVHVNLSKIVNI